MKIKIEEIEFDEDIYPRRYLSQQTIDGYTEALYAGAVFPPIELQKVRYDDNSIKNICLDGKHRFYAYKEFNNKLTQDDLNTGFKKIEEIDVKWYIEGDILSKSDFLEELQIRSAQLNLRHGMRLAKDDLANVCMRVVSNRPLDRLKGVINELAEKFSFAQNYISELQSDKGRITDVLARRRLSRDMLIFRLSLMGWTQQEIGDVFGKLDQSTVSLIMKNIADDIIHIQEEYKKGVKSVEEIAAFKNMDIVTTWAVILDGKSDLERFKLFGLREGDDIKKKKSDSEAYKPKDFTIWNFNDRDNRLGKLHAGNIPGQVAMNVLYRYTKQNDLVVDPMAGGGSTIDACLIMKRNCKAYDNDKEIANPQEGIIKRDLVKDGFASETKNCHLVFLDPPYWKQQKGNYTEEDTDLSNMPLDIFYEKMRTIFEGAYEILRKDGIISVITGLTQEKGIVYDHAIEFANMLSKDFTYVIRFIVPYTTQQVRAFDITAARKGNYVLKLHRDLLIYRK